ncbi:MAG: group III truncated hemoglobin [Acidobacteria bacterium]|nr:group III truncated hemoglobin [Acidobacteriota bacterium]
MRDVENRDDIDLLMREFYSRAMVDEKIGYLFTEVAHLDLDVHLPVIGDFWESMLFRTGDYGRHGRNPLQVHMALHMLEPLKREHFDRWLEIFHAVINENFAGPCAETLRERSVFMANRMLNFCRGVPALEIRH